MEEIVKHINDTNASYRTPNAGDAKNTDLFLDNEHYELFKGTSGQVTVRFNKENLSKAILFIASILPRKYDNSAIHKAVSYSSEFVYDQLAFLDYYFKEDGVSVMRKTQTWNARKDVLKKNGEIDNRFYFNGLFEEVEYVNSKGDHVSSKFTIRNYLAGGHSDLHIKKAEDGIFDVWVTNVREAYFDDKEDGLVELDRNTLTPLPLQQIFYGAPGTGKSHEIDGKTNDDNSIRTTFHPDTDYATFVGAYKPMMDTVEEYALDATGKTHKIDYPNEKSLIIYKYEPQVFLKAYVEAWKRYLNKQEGEDDSYYLIIEEINRGNCAQIFGDLFQLLDREDSGYSSYAISPESAITKYLAEDALSANGTRFSELEFSNVTKEREKGDTKIIATADDLKAGKRLVLPPNLHIWATMNTSDQSLFPIDSAFKRRWDWNYMPIKYDNNEWQIVLGNMKYPWPAFQKEINKRIYDATGSEDKQMGDWFVRAEANKISESLLLNKIVFYLWNDVCKDGEGDIFNIKTAEDKTETVTFSKFFEGNTTEKLQQWMAFLGIEGSKIDAKIEIDDEDDDDTKNHDSNQPYKVTFPDGKVICKGNSWDTYVASLQKIGLDKAFPFGEQYTRHNKTMPLITKEKIEDQGQYKYQYIDGYYVLSGTGSQHRLLKKINEKLGLGLTIE